MKRTTYKLIALLAAMAFTGSAAAESVADHKGSAPDGADRGDGAGRSPVVGTAISYQGELTESGAPFDGAADITFRLFDAASGGTMVAPAIVVSDVDVTSGRFVVELDFGTGVFAGDGRWLELEVGGVTLAPRQPLHPAPYALHALSAPGSGGDLWVYGTGTIHTTADVGIGTSSPDTPLEVIGEIRASGTGANIAVRNPDNVAAAAALSWKNDVARIRIGGNGAGSQNGLDVQGPGDTSLLRVTNSGRLGIGTTHPSARIHVRADDNHIIAERTYGVPLPGYTRLEINALGIEHTSTTFERTLFLNQNSDHDVALATGGGSVCIGGTQPQARLHVKGGTDTEPPSGGFIVLGETSSTNLSIDNNEIMARDDGQLSPLHLNADGGDVYIGYFSGGTSRVVVPVVEITGADVAERFPTSGRVEPGDVVEIDRDRPGELRLATGAYNRRVAGVVSGANDLPAGAILGNLPGSKEAPAIAMAGRVWVRCVGGVSPGDLLTTSDTPGHAMAVGDHDRAQGAIIGKAMTARDETTGMALMLISLQ